MPAEPCQQRCAERVADAGSLQPQSLLFSGIRDPGHLLERRLLVTSCHPLVSLCLPPSEAELTLAWPALIATNNEVASKLRTSYMWLLFPGAGWLLRCPPACLYSHGCYLNAMSLPICSGLCLPGAHLPGTGAFAMVVNLRPYMALA